MKKQMFSVEKIRDNALYKRVKFISSTLFSLFFLMAVFVMFFNLSHCVVAEESSYVPSAPSGPESGFLDTEYEYSIYTTNPYAFWMFDWGDGTYSDWISLEDSEYSITQSHSWASSEEYQVKVKFKNDFFQDGVFSPSILVTISEYNEDDFPDKPDAPSGHVIGCTGLEYSYTTYATDPKEDYVQYRFGWGDGIISEWTSLVRSGSVLSLSYSWENPGEYSILSQARDQYGLTSPWSDPSNVIMELDSDGDRLSDNTETQLDSNPNDSTDVTIVTINDIDHYIVCTSDSNIIFYNSSNGNVSDMKSKSGGGYLIDDDNDGKWNYVYYTATGIIEGYEKSSVVGISTEFPWLLTIIMSIIIGVIFAIIFLFKTGRIYIYEEYVVEE